MRDKIDDNVTVNRVSEQAIRQNCKFNTKKFITKLVLGKIQLQKICMF